MGPADAIVHTRAVLGQPGATAVACVGERIVAVGSRRAIDAHRGPRTRVVDVPAGLLCAGFHDAHFHLVPTAKSRMEPDLHGLSPGEIEAALGAAAADKDAGRWVIARGYDPRTFERPSDEAVRAGGTVRSLLDAACPDHPVLLRSHDYHAVAVNSRALTAMGFSDALLDAFGTDAERGPDGASNGILREHAAVTASTQSGDATEAELADGVREVIDDLHRHGITAVHEMSGSHDQAVVRGLDAEGRLGIDVFGSVSPSDVERAELTAHGQRLRIVGMKAFLDGALGSRTAHTLEPYCDGNVDTHRGLEVLSYVDAVRYVAAAARVGLAAWLHAIGDAAVRSALNAFDALPSDWTAHLDRPLRHRVEHAQMIHDDDLPRFAARGVVASVQPVHLALDAPLVRASWGDRSRTVFPLRRLADSGAPVALGSDAPIETYDPIAGLQCAVCRRARDGSILHAEEALSVREALDGYTRGAAWAVGAEDVMGTVGPGRLASLTILSNDPVATPAALAETQIAATLVRGEVVFEATR